MRQSFLAGLLAAAAALPGPALAQREDLAFIDGTRPVTVDAGQRGDFGGQRREGGWNGGGQRGDGGGFRQRGEGFQRPMQAPPAPVAPQAVPVAPSQVAPQFQQRDAFRQDRFQNRQQFQQDRFQNRQQFRQDRGFGQVPPVIAPGNPALTDQRRFGGQGFNGQGFNGQDGRALRSDRRDDFRGRPDAGQFRGDQFRGFNQNRGNGFSGNGFNSNRFGTGPFAGNGFRGNNGFYSGRGFDDRGGGRGSWNRGWRNDRQYDWQGFRSYNRDFFRLPPYYAPQGWGYGYRRFGIGLTLDALLFDQDYWIGDPSYYRLPPAYGPYQWVRYYNDALLIDVRSGYVVDAVYDIFY